MGSATVDLDAHEVSVDGYLLYLTASEFKLLVSLIENRGRVLTRTMMAELSIPTSLGFVRNLVPVAI